MSLTANAVVLLGVIQMLGAPALQAADVPPEQSSTPPQSAAGEEWWPVESFWGDVQDDPGFLHGPMDLVRAPNGEFFVTDHLNHRVQVLGPDATFRRTWGLAGSAPGQFFLPTGIALGPDGSVYVSDAANGRVQRFDSDGRYLGSFGSPAEGPSELGTPLGVAVDPSGGVLVGDTKRRRLQYFDALGRPGVGVEETPAGPIDPRDVAVSADGTFYVVDRARSVVWRVLASGEILGSFGEWGDESGQFGGCYDGGGRAPPRIFPCGGAWGVAVSPDGFVWVSDDGKDNVQQFTSTGEFRGRYFTGEAHIRGLAVGPDESSVFYAAFGKDHVGRPGADGYGSQPSLDDHLGVAHPYACAVDGEGGLAITDPHFVAYGGGSRRSKIVRFDALGSPRAPFSGTLHLRGIATSPEGHLVLTAHVPDRVVVLNRDGLEVLSWGRSGSGPGELSQPVGVAVAPDGTIVVADTGNRRVQAFDSAGIFLREWTTFGADARPFVSPLWVAIGPDGSIYVSDWGSKVIAVLELAGGAKATWEIPDAGAVTFGMGRLWAMIGREVVGFDGDGAVAVRLRPVPDRAVSSESWADAPGVGCLAGNDERVFVAEDGTRRVLVYGARENGWRIETYENEWLAGQSTVRIEASEALAMGELTGGSTGRSAKVSRTLQRHAGALEVRASGGVRLWAGERLVVDAWDDVGDRAVVAPLPGEALVTLALRAVPGGSADATIRLVPPPGRVYLPAIASLYSSAR